MNHSRKAQGDSPAVKRRTNGGAAATAQGRSSLLVGDLVETAFDSAAYVTSDPTQQLELAACHLGRLLGRLGDERLVGLLASTPELAGTSGPSSRIPLGVPSSDAAATAGQAAH